MLSADTHLKTIERRLSVLEQEKRSLLKQKQRFLACDRDSDKEAAPASSQEKVALFCGRQDVHAVRWENEQGRHGYAIACDNEWRQGFCYKPKIKCGECQNQSFQLMDHRAAYEHLSGQRTAGLYPLLTDETTWLWIFFKQPIPAATARRLGFTLLDRAMERHASLSFESYDRLFPNQDTLPAGG